MYVFFWKCICKKNRERNKDEECINIYKKPREEKYNNDFF